MSPYGLEKCAMYAPGPYAIPHIKVEARTIFTNRPISSSMRGFSVINGQFACEVHMNRIAEALEMDPWELRFINACMNVNIISVPWICSVTMMCR